MFQEREGAAPVVLGFIRLVAELAFLFCLFARDGIETFLASVKRSETVQSKEFRIRKAR